MYKMALVEYTGKIEEIVEMSDSVRLFKLKLDKPFDYKAGQFVNLSFEDEGDKYMRPYSIASDPDGSDVIELCIKLVENGRVTPHLFHKKVGDEVNVKGPFGMFTIEKGTKDKYVFVGTGTGIAPLRSMIKKLLKDGTDKELTLIFGVRHVNEVLFMDEFKKLEEENPNFKYVPIVSRPDDSWIGRSGHVQDNFDMLDIQNIDVFICGLPVMVEESMEKLIKLGVSESNIFHEKY